MFGFPPPQGGGGGPRWFIHVGKLLRPAPPAAPTAAMVLLRNDRSGALIFSIRLLLSCCLHLRPEPKTFSLEPKRRLASLLLQLFREIDAIRVETYKDFSNSSSIFVVVVFLPVSLSLFFWFRYKKNRGKKTTTTNQRAWWMRSLANLWIPLDSGTGGQVLLDKNGRQEANPERYSLNPEKRKETSRSVVLLWPKRRRKRRRRRKGPRNLASNLPRLSAKSDRA